MEGGSTFSHLKKVEARDVSSNYATNGVKNGGEVVSSPECLGFNGRRVDEQKRFGLHLEVSASIVRACNRRD